MEDIPLEDWRRTIDINLMDQFRYTDEKQLARAQGFFKFSLGAASSVRCHIIRPIKRNRLYVVTQIDAKLY